MTQTTDPKMHYISDWKTRAFARLAIYKKLASKHDAQEIVDFLRVVGNAEMEIEKDFLTCDGTKKSIDGFYEKTFEVLESIALSYAKISTAGANRLDVPGGYNLPNSSGSTDFPLHTGQEWQALQHLAGDARDFDSDLFRVNEQRGSLRHQRPRAPYFVELLQTDEERAAGHGVDLLRDATRALDIDSALIWLYVSELLSPIGALAPNTAAFAWIDIDDVARKTLGGYARNPKEREERRAQVYHAIKYGARAFVTGARSTRYKDKQTNQEISTRISVTPWQISGKEESETPCLWPELDVPLRLRLVASPEWTALTTNRNTEQWLPLAEKIGAMPGNQPGGAWARALALSYLTWCRIDVRAALDGKTPTRRALLDANTPKKTPYTELLGTQNANRIREYWATAESHLRDAGIIEAVKHSKIASQSGSDEWRDVWLNTSAPWLPGPQIKQALEAIAANQYLEKPRQLNPAKRRGRPRKKDAKK